MARYHLKVTGEAGYIAGAQVSRDSGNRSVVLYTLMQDTGEPVYVSARDVDPAGPLPSRARLGCYASRPFVLCLCVPMLADRLPSARPTDRRCVRGMPPL